MTISDLTLSRSLTSINMTSIMLPLSHGMKMAKLIWISTLIMALMKKLGVTIQEKYWHASLLCKNYLRGQIYRITSRMPSARIRGSTLCCRISSEDLETQTSPKLITSPFLSQSLSLSLWKKHNSNQKTNRAPPQKTQWMWRKSQRRPWSRWKLRSLTLITSTSTRTT